MQSSPQATTDELGGGRRNGFTVLELIVSIAVIGILMALLIPAVQSAREAGRRIECQNHLRQFGVAVHSFEANRGAYPRWRGPLVDDPATYQLEYWNHSVHLQLLSYLEQGTLASDEDFQGSVGPFWEPRVHHSPFDVRLAVFFCPSDSGLYGTNYRACTGAGPHEWRLPPAGGVFGRREETRSQDVVDGTSQTIMMSEKLISDLGADFDPLADFWFTGLDSVLPNGGEDATADEMLAGCASLQGSPAAYFPYAGLEWHPATFNATFYNHVAPPNAAFPDCSLESSTPNAQIQPGRGGNLFQAVGSFGARSAHPQSVNVLLTDGAVRTISDSIAINLWRALATIAGDEVVEF